MLKNVNIRYILESVLRECDEGGFGKMGRKEQQLHLLDALLYSVSQKAKKPEEFKLFFGAFWKDMAHAAGRQTRRTRLPREPQIYFSYVLCRNNEVLAAAMPCFLFEDRKEMPLDSRHLNALRAAGVPLFCDLLTEMKGGDGEPVLNLKSQNCPAPSGWRFPTVRVPSQLNGFLCKKGMAFDNSSSDFPSPVPTGYGTQLGLCEARWYGRNPAGYPRPSAGLYCSAAGWVNRVRPGEHPWGEGPDWARLPLDIRLEQLRTGQSGNPGHCMFALLYLEAMPVAPLLATHLSKNYIEKYRPELQRLYGPGVTYGQAARNAKQLRYSDSERGTSSLAELAALFGYDHKLRRAQSTCQKNKEDYAFNTTELAGQSLSARLAWAGILENGNPYLPLTGDCLEDVLKGLSRLIGTGAFEQEFCLKTLPAIREKLGDAWDGSLDGLVYELSVPDSVGADSYAILEKLLLEPFCLLEEMRSLDEKYSVLLEEIRKQNELLKKELERMNFDGSTR